MKLVDAWNGKGQASLRVREIKAPDLSREDCERVIIHLLLEGVLREDFHFTPYSTISYVLPGSKARVVQSGTKRIFMNFRTNSRQKKVSGYLFKIDGKIRQFLVCIEIFPFSKTGVTVLEGGDLVTGKVVSLAVAL